MMEKMKKISLLEWRIKKLNSLYRKGKAKVNDVEYDELISQLSLLDPDNELLKKGIIEKASKDMVPLPIRMGSLNKVKTAKELKKWVNGINADQFTITPKYDGISLLIDLKNHKAYTRGDGFEGQLRTKHVEAILGKYWDAQYGLVLPQKISLVWGEAILKNQTKLPETYKNLRNAVAGVYNSPDGYKNTVCSMIDFVAYGCQYESNESPRKWRQLTNLENANGHLHFKVASYYNMSKEEILEMGDEELFDYLNGIRHAYDYATDGVVIEVDSAHKRKELGRLSNGNPAYAIAYKDSRWDHLNNTFVTDIEYSVGKNGDITPVLLIEPVTIDGVTIERVTGYNFRYLLDHHIYPGAKVSIIRSGGVIPKHIETISYDEVAFDAYHCGHNATTCPSCGQPINWDNNAINKVCKNPKCNGKIISKIIYFFETLGCEGFKEPTIVGIFEGGYCKIDDILRNIESGGNFNFLGKVKSDTIIKQIKAHRYPSLAKFLTALDLSNGAIAEKTYQMIFDHLGSKKMVKKLLSVGVYSNEYCIKNFCNEHISGIKGIGDAKMKAFIKAITAYKNQYLAHDLQKLPLIKPRIKITKKKSEKSLGICFTGFRDKELEGILVKKGHTILNSVSKNCNILVAKDPNSGSSKLKKAVEMGIQVMSREELLQNI